MTTELIKHNPLLKKPLLTLLSLAEREPNADRRALETAALAVWQDSFSQSPAVSVDILVRHGALTEQVFVNGEPYDDTLQDLQLDENVADDAQAEARITLTDAGRELLAAFAPEVTLASLLNERPQYREAFLTVLRACSSAAGCSRADLEAALTSRPELAPDPSTGRARVYPQFFIDALESAGGIAWQNAWHTTTAGASLIEA